ncbi:DUF397 domain-containing protein [Streptomyces sp. NPDC060198]|uniref:DUF397 domain-containing protein n=1 Tax=Streptomyces sp. NPDC060198 TaxID=3347070 RepID=UPI00365B47F3
MNRTIDLSTVTWRKSTFSDGGQTNCLEVSDDFPGLVPVRDSKNPAGPVLTISARAWTAFVNVVREDTR